MISMITCGIDVGSSTVETVILDSGDLRVLAFDIASTGNSPAKSAEESFERALFSSGKSRSSVERVVSTGYGRGAVAFAHSSITEITCQARGVRHLFPEARTIFDIGGEDCKIIKLDPSGAVTDFVMNDRCAAGTGRFLEVISGALGLGVSEAGRISLKSRNPESLSATCVVFAESEVVSLLARGKIPEDVLAGIQRSVALRLVGLAGKIELVEPIVFTGGVAKNPGTVHYLARALGRALLVPEEPQITCAFGAALLASR